MRKPYSENSVSFLKFQKIQTKLFAKQCPENTLFLFEKKNNPFGTVFEQTKAIRCIENVYAGSQQNGWSNKASHIQWSAISLHHAPAKIPES